MLATPIALADLDPCAAAERVGQSSAGGLPAECDLCRKLFSGELIVGRNLRTVDERTSGMSGEDRFVEALERLQEAEDEVVDAAIDLVQADDRNEAVEAYAALREAVGHLAVRQLLAEKLEEEAQAGRSPQGLDMTSH
jgi:hypothetical protein